MRFKLLEENGNIKHNGDYYYAVSMNGKNSLVDAKWVKSNKDYISNVGVSGNRIYKIQDKYDKAVEIIKRYIRKSMTTSSGLDVSGDFKMLQFNNCNHKPQKLDRKSTIADSCNLLAFYGEDVSGLYMSLAKIEINRAIEKNGRIYIVVNHVEAFDFTSNKIFTDKGKADKNVIKNYGDLFEIHNSSELNNYIKID